MKQALKQQGFESLSRKHTEWKAWMEREKESLAEIAQEHKFEIISLGGRTSGTGLERAARTGYNNK